MSESPAHDLVIYSSFAILGRIRRGVREKRSSQIASCINVSLVAYRLSTPNPRP